MIKIKFSVIIPVYNEERYINQSIKSVIEQTYHAHEIIVVDDGSTDNTATIVHEMQKKHKNIFYFYQENGRQGKARNLGIKESSGDYIIFLDGDDTLNNKLLEKLNHELSKKEYDMVFYGHCQIRERNKKVNREPQKEIVAYINEGKASRIKAAASPAFSAYSRQFIHENKILFLEGIVFEDIDFIIRTTYLCENASYVNYIGYNYFLRADSTVRSSDCQKNLDSIISFDHSREYISNNGDLTKFKKELEYCSYKYLFIEAKLRILESDCDVYTQNKALDSIDTYIRSTIGIDIDYSLFNIKEKLFIFLLRNKRYSIISFLRKIRRILNG